MTEQKLRTIKSFIRRQGRLSKARKEALSSDWEKWGLTSEKGLLNLDQLFTETGPTILEIGFGMGDSLIQMVLAEPRSRFIGVEVHKPGVANLLVNIEKNQLPNLRVFHEDALIVLNQAIPNKSLDRVQLFFPDPWPKTRHHKRRIVQPEFIKLISMKLKNGGIFHLATDWEDYAKQMLTMLEAETSLTNQFPLEGFAPRPAWRPKTKFEQRGQKLGYSIWDLLFVCGQDCAIIE